MNKNLIIEKASPKNFPNVYKTFMVGEKGWLELLRYELITLLFGSLPGALGFLCRFFTYSSLFRKCERGVIFGKNLNIFVPSNICLSNGVMLEDYATLNAKTGKIILENGVFISRYSYLNSHPDGCIHIGSNSGLGLNSIIHGGGGVEVGKDVMLAPQSYIISQTYNFSDTQIPIKYQGIKKAKVTIEDDVFIGVGAKILPGVTIGKGAIVGAASVVTHDIPAYSFAYGIPARVKKMRK